MRRLFVILGLRFQAEVGLLFRLFRRRRVLFHVLIPLLLWWCLSVVSTTPTGIQYLQVSKWLGGDVPSFLNAFAVSISSFTQRRYCTFCFHCRVQSTRHKRDNFTINRAKGWEPLFHSLGGCMSVDKWLNGRLLLFVFCLRVAGPKLPAQRRCKQLIGFHFEWSLAVFSKCRLGTFQPKPIACS